MTEAQEIIIPIVLKISLVLDVKGNNQVVVSAETRLNDAQVSEALKTVVRPNYSVTKKQDWPDHLRTSPDMTLAEKQRIYNARLKYKKEGKKAFQDARPLGQPNILLKDKKKNEPAEKHWDPMEDYKNSNLDPGIKRPPRVENAFDFRSKDEPLNVTYVDCANPKCHHLHRFVKGSGKEYGGREFCNGNCLQEWLDKYRVKPKML